MSMNYVLGFSMFLLALVALNIYFFYILSSVTHKPNKSIIPSIKKAAIKSNVFNDINDHLNNIPNQFKRKNSIFSPIQRDLLSLYLKNNFTDTETVWNKVQNWTSEESLFPNTLQMSGQILHAMKTSKIELVDNAQKGTQMKLLLILEGKQKLFFKPKRYTLSNVITGDIYAGFDRHNSEVFAYYLAMVLDFKWIAPSVIRKLNVFRDILPVSTIGLKKTMIKNAKGSVCIYGKCYYCKKNETVCPDANGDIEGAAILYLDKQFSIHKSPWQRSYTGKNMEWEKDNEYCKKVSRSLNTNILLDLIDISIFDFLIQNGDRHRYEVYKHKIVLLDNGKGLGNPTVDVMDILAPLYQCCLLRVSTWQRLQLISGGALTETIKLLATSQSHEITTEAHYKAIELRLLKVYATVQYCVKKYGSFKVFKQ